MGTLRRFSLAAPVFAAAALLGSARTTVAIDCYVDPIAGSDLTGNGHTNPWRTLTYAAQQVAQSSPCSAIVLAPGRYDAASGEAFPVAIDMRLSIRGAPGLTSILATEGLPAITASCFEGFWPGTLTGLVIDGTVAGTRASAVAIGVMGCTRTPRRDQPNLDGNLIRGFGVGLRSESTLVILSRTSADANLTFCRNEFRDNDIAIEIQPGSSIAAGKVDRSTIANNIFDGNGIAIRVRASDSAGAAPGLWNNTIVRAAGPAMQFEDGPTGYRATPDIVNNIIAHGAASAIDDALATPQLINRNLFWSNAGPDWMVGANATPTQVRADPQFVDLVAGDLHLVAGSPALDTGDDLVWPFDVATDKDGDSRTLDGGTGVVRTDIGAYERRTRPGVLRTATFSALKPVGTWPYPRLPIAPNNPDTPLLLADYQSGDPDPRPAILGNLASPLILYRSDTPEVLALSKDAPAGTVRFFAR